MGESHAFAVDVLRTVCDWLEARAGDLRLLVEAGLSFEEWLNREASYPFCEVTAKPTYASEGVADDDGDPEL